MSNKEKLKNRSLKKYRLWRLLPKIDFSKYVFVEQVNNDNGGTIIKPDNNIGYWVRI